MSTMRLREFDFLLLSAPKAEIEALHRASEQCETRLALANARYRQTGEHIGRELDAAFEGWRDAERQFKARMWKRLTAVSA